MERHYDVFLCYNRRDQPAARTLAETLKARGLKVWLDEWELPGGSDWQAEMEKGIERSRAVVVAVGGTGLGRWHTQEVRGALLLSQEQGLPVIPVLVAGASMNARARMTATSVDRSPSVHAMRSSAIRKPSADPPRTPAASDEACPAEDPNLAPPP